MKSPKFLLFISGLILAAITAIFWLKTGPSQARPDNNSKNKKSTEPLSGFEARPTARSTAVQSKRTFAVMDVNERNAVLMEIKKQDFAVILQTWLDAGRVDHDLMKQSAVSSLLAAAIRERKPGAEVFDQIRGLVANPSCSNVERGMLLGALGYARTRECVELLIEAASTLTERELKQVAITAIRSVGGLWGDGTFHEELSPPLERAWRESDDPHLIVVVAIALAEVGASSGMGLLVQAIAFSPQGDEQRASAARDALSAAAILNPHAVPPLASAIGNQPPGSTTGKLLAETLVRVGTSAAGKALLEWLQKSEEAAASDILQLVIRTRTPAMLQAWESALDPSALFKREQNREAVRASLDVYRKRRI